MNYNYPQTQCQTTQYPGYGGYKPAPQYLQWTQTGSANLQVRPVSSIDEVKACPIDFDGSVFYFTDMANKKIYTKQINIDGTATINIYELKNLTQADQDANSFITRQEFENTVNQIREAFNKIITTQQQQIVTVEESKQEDIQQTPAAQPKPIFVF